MRLKSEKGQAMVEFALVLPLLLLLLFGIIDFGWIFANQLLANNAVREAARYTAIHYYDSSADNDQQAAYNIVVARAPTLVSPTVTLTPPASGGNEVTIAVTSPVAVLSPIASVFIDGETYTIKASCTMRLE